MDKASGVVQMRLNLRKLVLERLGALVQRLGGSKDNIPKAIVKRTWLNIIAMWLWLSPDFRPPFWRWIRKYKTYKKYNNSSMFHIHRKPLWDWANKHNPKNIMEIGLGDGTNAKKIIDLCPDCTYYSFDNLSHDESIKAYKFLKSLENVRFFVGDTKKTLGKYKIPPMDLIFIDGGHDYRTVKNDWEHCKLLMHESTACFFHDYDLLGPWMVVKEIQDNDEYLVKVIEPSVSSHVFALIERKKVN